MSAIRRLRHLSFCADSGEGKIIHLSVWRLKHPIPTSKAFFGLRLISCQPFVGLHHLLFLRRFGRGIRGHAKSNHSFVRISSQTSDSRHRVIRRRRQADTWGISAAEHCVENGISRQLALRHNARSFIETVWLTPLRWLDGLLTT
jgi:hypothetical protein